MKSRNGPTLRPDHAKPPEAADLGPPEAADLGPSEVRRFKRPPTCSSETGWRRVADLLGFEVGDTGACKPRADGGVAWIEREDTAAYLLIDAYGPLDSHNLRPVEWSARIPASTPDAVVLALLTLAARGDGPAPKRDACSTEAHAALKSNIRALLEGTKFIGVQAGEGGPALAMGNCYACDTTLAVELPEERTR